MTLGFLFGTALLSSSVCLNLKDVIEQNKSSYIINPHIYDKGDMISLCDNSQSFKARTRICKFSRTDLVEMVSVPPGSRA